MSFLDEIQDFLMDGPALMADVADHFGITKKHADIYLARLTRRGLVERLPEKVKPPRGRPASVYVLKRTKAAAA